MSLDTVTARELVAALLTEESNGHTDLLGALLCVGAVWQCACGNRVQTGLACACGDVQPQHVCRYCQRTITRTNERGPWQDTYGPMCDESWSADAAHDPAE